MRKAGYWSLCIAALCSVAVNTSAIAQERPFVFTFTTPQSDTNPIVLHYNAAYGRRTFEPLGANNTEQVIGIHSGIGQSFTAIAKIGFAFNNSAIASSQHVEVLRQFTRSQNSLVDFSFGPGFRHEYSGTDVLLARAIIGRRFSNWQFYSNCVLEKPLSNARDELDLFFSIGSLHRVSSSIQLGFEAVGQDLEGFWVLDEAEGGATLFVGPTIVVDFPASPWTLTLGAGPIIRATKSLQTSLAPRDLPDPNKNGFIVHTAFNFMF